MPAGAARWPGPSPICGPLPRGGRALLLGCLSSCSVASWALHLHPNQMTDFAGPSPCLHHGHPWVLATLTECPGEGRMAWSSSTPQTPAYGP